MYVIILKDIQSKRSGQLLYDWNRKTSDTNLFMVWLCCISAAWFMARIQPFMSSCVSALKKYVRIPQCSACEPITEFLL